MGLDQIAPKLFEQGVVGIMLLVLLAANVAQWLENRGLRKELKELNTGHLNSVSALQEKRIEDHRALSTIAGANVDSNRAVVGILSSIQQTQEAIKTLIIDRRRE